MTWPWPPWTCSRGGNGRRRVERLRVFPLSVRRLDWVAAFGVLQQTCGDLRGSDESMMLTIRLIDDVGNNREKVSLFPRRFHSCVTQVG